jgi:hypothetical protein
MLSTTLEREIRELMEHQDKEERKEKDFFQWQVVTALIEGMSN